jgi:hypothetical protein
MRFGAVRRIIPAALAVVAVVAPLSSRAVAPVRFHWASQAGGVAALPPLIQTCTLTAGPIDFIGYKRTNGTIYGTFYWGSNLSCAQAMSYMRSYGHITKLPTTNIYRGSPGVCGVDSNTALKNQNCRYVQMSGGTYYCDPCNGSWTFSFEWQFRFGPLQVASVSIIKTNITYSCTTSVYGRWNCSATTSPPYVLN